MAGGISEIQIFLSQITSIRTGTNHSSPMEFPKLWSYSSNKSGHYSQLPSQTGMRVLPTIRIYWRTLKQLQKQNPITTNIFGCHDKHTQSGSLDLCFIQRLQAEREYSLHRPIRERVLPPAPVSHQHQSLKSFTRIPSYFVQHILSANR